MPDAARKNLFTVNIERHGSTAIVHCNGKLLAEYAERLYQPVSELLPTHQRVILDLSGVTQMDSMGLGALVRVYVSSKGKGCSLELRHIGKKVRDLLIITNLLPAFTFAGEHHLRM